MRGTPHPVGDGKCEEVHEKNGVAGDPACRVDRKAAEEKQDKRIFGWKDVTCDEWADAEAILDCRGQPGFSCKCCI